MSGVYVGLDVVDGATTYGLDGLYVVGVHPNGPADRAGVRSGDVVSHVEGVSVKTKPELRRALDMAGVGRVAHVTLSRDVGGQSQRCDIVLSLQLVTGNGNR